MILVVATIIALLIALLRGGRLTRLAELRLRYAWLVLAAVVLQYLLVYDILPWPALPGISLVYLLTVVSYLMLLGMVWANRSLPGMLLVGLGIASNLIVMMANGGWMPITPEAVEWLGHSSRVAEGSVARVWGSKDIVLPRGSTRLWWLSDVFVLVPPFPVASAFSIGDMLTAVGVFWLLQGTLIDRRGCSLCQKTA